MEFQRTVDIVAPPDIVWAVMSDVERWHEWTASVRGIRRLDAGPLGVGSRVIIRQPKFPPALWTITALEPGRRFIWMSGAPGLRVYAYHSVEALGAASRVALRLRYEGAIGRWLARLTRGITERYLDLEATGLKRRSEARAAGQSR